MRNDKRNEIYYWIKLRQDLMQSKEMKLLMRQPDGGWYFSIYVYLIMLSINSNGRLIQKVNEMELIYDLTTITQELMFFKIDTIRVAIDMLMKLGLLYEDASNIICITGFDKLVGSETGWAEVKRKQKEKQLMEDSVEKVHAIVHGNFPPELRDKSIEYKVDINGNIQPSKLGSKFKRIDGAVALIIAYAVLNRFKSEYEGMIR